MSFEFRVLSSNKQEFKPVRPSMWLYNVKNTFLERLPHDGDLLLSIRNVFASNNIRMGTFMAIGAVKNVKMAFYKQSEKVFENLSIDEPAEILSCFGNISEADGEILAHAHITLGLKDGTTRGGHLLEGTHIFAGELFGAILEGEQLKRGYDEVTGLKLWSL
jgi:uncharacterized protein